MRVSKTVVQFYFIGGIQRITYLWIYCLIHFHGILVILLDFYIIGLGNNITTNQYGREILVRDK